VDTYYRTELNTTADPNLGKNTSGNLRALKEY
jgi:hypothetical protein